MKFFRIAPSSASLFSALLVARVIHDGAYQSMPTCNAPSNRS